VKKTGGREEYILFIVVEEKEKTKKESVGTKWNNLV